MSIKLYFANSRLNLIVNIFVHNTKSATYLNRYVSFNVVPSTQVTSKHNSHQQHQLISLVKSVLISANVMLRNEL